MKKFILDLIEDENWEDLRVFLGADSDLIGLLLDGADQAIHIAAYTGSRAFTDVLLEFDADVNARGNKGRTPLHIALRAEHYELAELFVSNGALFDLADQTGTTAYKLAAENIVSDEGRAFYERVVPKDSTQDLNALLVAGLFDQVRTALSEDPAHAISQSPNAQALIEDALNGFDRLNRTMDETDLAILDLLVSAGAPLDCDGVSSLFYACQGQRADVVERLLLLGADPNLTTEGVHLLDVVMNSPISETMRSLLVKHGAQPSELNRADG